MELEDRIKRWRLILGEDSEAGFAAMGDTTLSGEQDLMDQALAAIYDNTGSGGGFGGGLGGSSSRGLGGSSGARGAGKGPSAPVVSKWLGDVRSLFDKDLVSIIQADAMERCGLKQLMFEPELLEKLEPDLNLASMMLTLKDQIPKRSKEQVRAFISRIVEELNRLLANDIRRAVTAAVDRKRHSPIPSASALDYKETIRRNLKNYNPELKRLVPEHFYFYDRTSKNMANRYTIILDVDQSGSMGESVIYSSVISCILASIQSLKTHIVAFDTNIVDLTEKCDDPVDLLFGFQLGGGTDIEKSVAYCQQLITSPKKTLFFLISDLMEGGNRAGLLRRLDEMKDSGVAVCCLLAIADGGKPYYDEHIAGRIASMGIPCFACSPQKIPQLLERALKGQDLTAFQKELERAGS